MDFELLYEKIMEEGAECTECGTLIYDPEYIDPIVCKRCAREEEIEGEEDTDDDQ